MRNLYIVDQGMYFEIKQLLCSYNDVSEYSKLKATFLKNIFIVKSGI